MPSLQSSKELVLRSREGEIKGAVSDRGCSRRLRKTPPLLRPHGVDDAMYGLVCL